MGLLCLVPTLPLFWSGKPQKSGATWPPSVTYLMVCNQLTIHDACVREGFRYSDHRRDLDLPISEFSSFASILAMENLLVSWI